MKYFGEREGAASYSRDRLIGRQVRALRGVAEYSRHFPDRVDFSVAVAQQYVNRMIILEQFPRKRITGQELSELANLKSLLRYDDMSKVDIVEAVARVASNA